MVIHSGNRGSQVTQLQRELRAAGFNPGAVDGIFGQHTLAAVRAYQHRHHLAADGLVGPRTWHALMTDGFTPGQHASHPATHPAPVTQPAPAGGSHAAKVQRMLAEARSHLGFHEGAGNRNPFSRFFGRPSEAWCADFVSSCATKAGLHLNTASAQGVANALAARGLWKGRHDPQPGDAVTFRWDGSHGWADHVGLVEKVYRQNGHLSIQTIEGNSSDQVRRKTYRADSSVINGFGSIS